ncbi:hypothetical protein SBDP1_190033 [Syntrophobacter sp. SbD1]|nr:hypothetical protein SBDP1_190033 [Syntrophobacter sp. SbD1]
MSAFKAELLFSVTLYNTFHTLSPQELMSLWDTLKTMKRRPNQPPFLQKWGFAVALAGC